MQSIKLVAQAESDKLAKRKAEIEATDLARTMWIPRGMTLFFTVQLAVGYGAIFHVPWLGWDLVEPLTFSVGQGSFIIALLYVLRNRGVDVDLYTGLEEHWSKQKAKRWEAKYGFDLQRYEFLREKLARIEKQLARAEKQRFE